MHPLAIVATALVLCKAALAYNESLPIEQLFLDLPIEHVISNSSGMPTLEPWATEYVAAIRQGRYGDAVWARYHIAGEVTANGTIRGTNLTVLDSMLEDGDEYSADEPDLYAEAVKFYNTSNGDTHTEVLELIASLNGSHPAKVERRNKTWGIKCSHSNKAETIDCIHMLDSIAEYHIYLGTLRSVASLNSCHLRVGPYRGISKDLTWYTAHKVGSLIEDDCLDCGAPCKVSGYSPENSGHRKVCLSSKSTGCS